MRVKIFLHGHLKEKIGADFVYTEARTAYEALKSIGTRYRKVLKAPLDLGKWKVKLKDYDTREKIMGAIRHNVLHLYPSFRTAKSGGATQMIVGFVMIVVGAILVCCTGGAWAAAGEYLIKGGIAMMCAGALSLIMAPDLSTADGQTKDQYLGAADHTTAAGTRIPFGYGKYRITGHYISYNISSTYYTAG